MAYDPTIPALNNYIGDDIPKIMANFAELAGSRIVEMGSNSNGEYVRWENGLQVCIAIASVDLSVSGDNDFPYPATFNGSPLGAGGLWDSTTSSQVRSAFKDSLVMRDSSRWRVHVGTTMDATRTVALFAIGMWK